MGCSGHQSPGLFTHPSDKSLFHNKLSYWTDLAKLLEKGACAVTQCAIDHGGC